MDAEACAFYLTMTPAQYEAAGPVTFERIFDDLTTYHGARRAGEMGKAFLAAELRDYLAAAPVVLLDGQSYRAGDMTPAGVTGGELAGRIADQVGAELGACEADLTARALALLRHMLTLYAGKNLVPLDRFPAFWQDVRDLLTEAEEGRADG